MKITQVEIIAILITVLLGSVFVLSILISLLRRARQGRCEPIIQEDSDTKTIATALRRQPPAIVVPPMRVIRKADQPITVTVRPKPIIVRPKENVPVQFTIDANQSGISAVSSN
jgi:hypothetical protein